MKEYNLTRFLSAQEATVDGYSQALAEIRSGRKVHHWIWYIFPQLHGLGKSSNSVFYGIRGPGEAKAYLLHPVLKSRLLEISKALLELETAALMHDAFRSSRRGFDCFQSSVGKVLSRQTG